MNSAAVTYPSEPLKCWPRFLELKGRWEKEIWTARERNSVIILGVPDHLHALTAGLGRCYFLGGMGPNLRKLAEDKELLAKCIEAAEVAGYGADVCVTLRATYGATLLGEYDKTPDGGSMKADFVLSASVCQAQNKTDQLWYTRDGTPVFMVEVPASPTQKQFLADQMHECIDWMQQVTGREYHDDLLIKATAEDWDFRRLWARLCMLQKNVPAPIDEITLYQLQGIHQLGGDNWPDVMAFLRMLLDEVEDRVRRGVSLRPYETARLALEGGATWFKSDVLRYPLRFGARYLGNWQTVTVYGAYEVGSDYALSPAPSLEDIGLPLRNRDDAVAALAVLLSDYFPEAISFYNLDFRLKTLSKMYQDWKIDGVVFKLDRGCRGMTMGMMATGLYCKQLGIPVMYFEGSVGNPREMDEGAYKAKIDSFMEMLKLKPLE